VDAVPKITGRAVYTEALPFPPGTLYGAILRSPYAHVRLISIDARRAEQLPGVHAVVTREHLGNLTPFLDPASYGAKCEGGASPRVLQQHPTADTSRLGGWGTVRAGHAHAGSPGASRRARPEDSVPGSGQALFYGVHPAPTIAAPSQPLTRCARAPRACGASLGTLSSKTGRSRRRPAPNCPLRSPCTVP